MNPKRLIVGLAAVVLTVALAVAFFHPGSDRVPGTSHRSSSPAPDFTPTGAGNDAGPDTPGSATQRPDLPQTQADSAAHREIIRVLRSVRIPVIAFEDTSVEEAIDFLRLRSVELDPEPDPTRKGVSLRLDLRKSPADAHGQAAEVPAEIIGRRLINLEAKEIDLWDALNRVAQQADLQLTIKEDGVHLRPR